MNDESLLKKRIVEGCFTTELRENETITVNGPATFKLVESNSSGHAKRSRVQIIAPKETKILKNWKEKDV